MKNKFNKEELDLIKRCFGEYKINSKGNIEVFPKQDIRHSTIKYCIYKSPNNTIFIKRQIVNSCGLRYFKLFKDNTGGVWNVFTNVNAAIEKLNKYLASIKNQ